MLRDTNARYLGLVVMARVRATNPDGGYPFVTRQVSKVGPFDFSAAVSAAAVTITAKTDNGSVVADTVDLSAVAAIDAVTAAELNTAIGVAAVTNVTSSIESGTGRVKLALTTPGSAKYLQIGGEIAKYAGFGYGYGTEFSKIETVQSLAQEAVQKESERLEVLDSAGRPTAIITRSYRTGSTLTLIDTAFDINLRAKLEGGSFRDDGYTDDAYLAPGSNDIRPNIEAEWFHGVYAKDDSQEDNRVGYLWLKCRSAKLTKSPGTDGGRNFQTGTYTLAVTPYKDPISGSNDEKDTVMQFLTVSEYDALHVLTV
jgi:hypothetical protein